MAKSSHNLGVCQRPILDLDLQMLGLWFHQRPTLIASVIEHTSMFCESRLIRFHVKHAIASVTTGCLHTGMTEHEHVGSEGAQHSNIKTAVAC